MSELRSFQFPFLPAGTLCLLAAVASVASAASTKVVGLRPHQGSVVLSCPEFRRGDIFHGWFARTKGQLERSSLNGKKSEGYDIDPSTKRLLIKHLTRINVADQEFVCVFERPRLSSLDSTVKKTFKERTVTLVTAPSKYTMVHVKMK